MPQDTTRPVFIAPFDLDLFARGEHWDLYRILGAHPHTHEDGTPGYRFAVWAPNAQAVSVIGAFNDWTPEQHPLFPVGSSGIWAAFLPEMERDRSYKFAVRQQNGKTVFKTDPCALAAESRPGNAAVTSSLCGYQWNDEEWMESRRQLGLPLEQPVSIYEVHAGSWRRPDGRFPTYDELADELIPYARDLGFTHLEFLPLAEHPLDESWGYQTSHYFAPSSRFGSPDQFRTLIDRCHQAGLGVILDWVPAHFPKDEWSLGRFDGTALYEHQDPRLGEHPDWGTYIFNLGRYETANFLLANALYWLKEFHIDGLRIDAVASMLYRDYSRKDGEWVPNQYGGNENLEAIAFLRRLNTVVHAHYPGACVIAEESTSWPGVSRPVYTGGLGFTFKWNMGWMNDTLNYFQKEPIHRSHHHQNLTFSMLYAFSENFLLPLSHDEVVHGKGALLAKMPGDDWQKFANLRLLLAYQWAHPGKKLLFMGGEFGQWSEWCSGRELDWGLLDFPRHRGISRLVGDLNNLLRTQPAMYIRDNEWAGFQWLDLTDHNASVISFLRKAPDAPPVLWVFNFTPVPRHAYAVPCPLEGRWYEALNTDSSHYGGSNLGNGGHAAARTDNGGPCLRLTLPPLAALAFVHQKK
ncbi:1,4-alpha-glucan branching enzyme [Paucidesulfovibrio gracilis DSM 16080]|uniref:1,4-alpha-glucan branching enzyme GlgB n=1 Tax=Paucidesulfovibrio gracilis DSM 16080 TaxID=1121449 RepID=A0A1T4WBC2_9BACT|nr:1,4-alpha-glucan branching protein GlgB [Paucidesulfovibrio gracilis]SKA74573.1 1,4-alpha-glucan branching enzyme [Paucidesulfovibrio gracilis DSM 16080]